MDVGAPPSVELRTAVEPYLHQPHHPGIVNLCVAMTTSVRSCRVTEWLVIDHLFALPSGSCRRGLPLGPDEQEGVKFEDNRGMARMVVRCFFRSYSAPHSVDRQSAPPFLPLSRFLRKRVPAGGWAQRSTPPAQWQLPADTASFQSSATSRYRRGAYSISSRISGHADEGAPTRNSIIRGFPAIQVKPLFPSRSTTAPCPSVSTIRADFATSTGPADTASAVLLRARGAAANSAGLPNGPGRGPRINFTSPFDLGSYAGRSLDHPE
jgi:hypothetical protein